jgi:hypothetical protein
VNLKFEIDLSSVYGHVEDKELPKSKKSRAEPADVIPIALQACSGVIKEVKPVGCIRDLRSEPPQIIYRSGSRSVTLCVVDHACIVPDGNNSHNVACT